MFVMHHIFASFLFNVFVLYSLFLRFFSFRLLARFSLATYNASLAWFSLYETLGNVCILFRNVFANLCKKTRNRNQMTLCIYCVYMLLTFAMLIFLKKIAFSATDFCVLARFELFTVSWLRLHFAFGLATTEPPHIWWNFYFYSRCSCCWWWCCCCCLVVLVLFNLVFFCNLCTEKTIN